MHLHSAKRGSVVHLTSCAPSRQLPQTAWSTRCSDSMSSSLGRKKLVCFYCGRRSGLKQNGFVREWECTNCEAVNYLDENGEITDPPVATTLEAPMTVQFAQALPRSTSPFSNPDEALFCDDCLKNQHLFTASLAQYIPDDEKTLYDRKYYEFRNNLEKRYPQVCSDCEAGVLERIKQAGYTARTDHLRRLMDKTRSSHAKKAKTSWTEVFQFWGGAIWWLGLAGQACWNFSGIFGSARPHISALCTPGSRSLEFSGVEEPDEPQFALNSLAYPVETACWMWTRSLHCIDIVGIPIPTLVKWSLILSILSIWWNPKYRQMVRGFDSQIKGFREWYKYQIFLIIIRLLFQFLMGTEIFSDSEASITLGAHTFMLLLVSILAFSAQRSIKIDLTRLFAPTPERLRPYVQRKRRSSKADMGMALNDIAEERSQLSTSSISQDLSFDLSLPRISPTGARRNAVFQNHAQRRLPGGIALPGLHDGPLLSAMTPDESHDFVSRGTLPERLQYRHEEEMEWDPAPSQGLIMARPPQIPSLFRSPESPPQISDPSPFWFKVPPAPVGPAHRLRNPPNQPRFQPRTEEAKQNFFDNLRGASYGGRLQDDTSGPNRPRRQQIDIAQQKFFPPSSTADSMLNGLSEMFGTVHLQGESESGARADVRSVKEVDSSRTWRHISTIVVLIFSSIGWGYAYSYQSPQIWNINLAVIAICGSVAIRSFLDHTIRAWLNGKPLSKDVLIAMVSGVEAAVAARGGFDILVNQPQLDACPSQIALLLMGVMVAHEVYLAMF